MRVCQTWYVVMFWMWHVLMMVTKTAGGRAYQEAIAEMGNELTKVIEDFMRAVDVEALRLAKKSGKHALSQSGSIFFSVVSCRASRTRASRTGPFT